jgi:hypothetical protein
MNYFYNIRNSVCTPAKLPCRRVEVGYEVLCMYIYFKVVKKSVENAFIIMNKMMQEPMCL